MLTIGRYLISRYRYPELDHLGILTGGIGIRRRAKELATYWSEHLERSRSIIERWIDQRTGKRVAVIGAGSLLDIEIRHLSRRFPEITLIDADPLLGPIWKKLARRHSHSTFTFEHVEFSGVLLSWIEELRARLDKSPKKSGESWAAALKTIRAIPAELPPFANGGPGPTSKARVHTLDLTTYDCVISLNLLSQLPLCWQDAVGRELLSRFGEEWLSKHEESWLLAAREGGAALVHGHLRQLAATNASQIILLTDTEYLFYHSATYRLVEEPPLQWQLESSNEDSTRPHSGTWIPNDRYNADEFTFELMNALAGVEIESSDVLQKLFAHYQIRYGAPWIWNLVPFGAEEKSEGELHRVIAVQFLRES